MIIKNSLRSKLIQIAIFFSIFSQLPFIRISLGIDTQVITYFCWGVVFFTTLLKETQISLKTLKIKTKHTMIKTNYCRS